MKRYLLPLLAIAVIGTASAQDGGTQTPIMNPNFSADVLSCAVPCSQPNITGWVVGPVTGIVKVSTVQYPAIPSGTDLYVAYIGGYPCTGSIMQTLGSTLRANTTYVLKLSVGARTDEPFTGYIATLAAGNVPLASGNSATPVGGSFVSEVIVYKSGPDPAQLGQPLQVVVRSLGSGQVNIANVTLSAN